MPITKEQAIDILDKFDFFEGQRAGRELWGSKPPDIQEQDIKSFSRDVALLKEYISDVAPKSVGWWDKTLEKAIKMLEEEYELAKKQGWINKPLAYALYQVWKKADDKGE